MRPFVLAAVVVALSVPAPSVIAQSPPPPSPSLVQPTADGGHARTRSESGATPDVAAGPRRQAGRAGITAVARDDVVAAPRPIPIVQESRRRNGQILTIVGGAIFLAGLLMDDDDIGTVVALGGLAVGVYGLIQWLQASVAGVTSP